MTWIDRWLLETQFGKHVNLPRWVWIFDLGFRERTHRPPGWMFQMGVFALLALLLFSGVLLKAPLGGIFTVVCVIDLAASYHFVGHSTRQLRRLGPFGCLRPRWWIEMAALIGTLSFSFGFFWLELGFRGAAVAPWIQQVAAFSLTSARSLYFLFFPVALIAYCLGIIRPRPLHGLSLEFVNFYFWLNAMLRLSFLLPEIRALGEIVAPILAVVGLLSAAIAGCLELRRRYLISRLAPTTENAPVS